MDENESSSDEDNNEGRSNNQANSVERQNTSLVRDKLNKSI